MANTQETIADIIAEIRALSNPISDGIIAINGKSIAERLEAAHKRERAKIEADALAVGGIVEAERKRERGDCAKLREALKAISGLCDRLIPTWDGAIGRIKDIAEAALAAPPRNCDCFKTAAEAIDAYQDLTGDQLATDSGMKEWVEFAVWLFAPAAMAREGGMK